MSKKKSGVLVIHTAKLTAKTKAGRKAQFDRILAESEKMCASLESWRSGKPVAEWVEDDKGKA